MRRAAGFNVCCARVDKVDPIAYHLQRARSEALAQEKAMTTLVFANGDLKGLSWIRPQLADANAVIAADGGARHLWRLGHLPDLVIGDMDSLPREVRDWLESGDVPMLVHPHLKDETDLELALLHAAQTGDEIVIIGGFGGRFDQTLANIMLLAHPALHGRRVEMRTQYERAWLMRDYGEIHGEVGDTISLIPLGGDVLVARTTGLQWPLEDEVLAFGPARGVSNVLTETVATIQIASGLLLCLHTRQAWGR
jgi:thiamine pyrophosphokinase